MVSAGFELNLSLRYVDSFFPLESVQESHPNPLTGYPQLIGTSKKSFLGAILAQDPRGRETEPDERMWATAAAVTCAVQQGALIVRVHDVKEMADVVKVAEALW